MIQFKAVYAVRKRAEAREEISRLEWTFSAVGILEARSRAREFRIFLETCFGGQTDLESVEFAQPNREI